MDKLKQQDTESEEKSLADPSSIKYSKLNQSNDNSAYTKDFIKRLRKIKEKDVSNVIMEEKFNNFDNMQCSCQILRSASKWSLGLNE